MEKTQKKSYKYWSYDPNSMQIVIWWSLINKEFRGRGCDKFINIFTMIKCSGPTFKGGMPWIQWSTHIYHIQTKHFNNCWFISFINESIISTPFTNTLWIKIEFQINLVTHLDMQPLELVFLVLFTKYKSIKLFFLILVSVFPNLTD